MEDHKLTEDRVIELLMPYLKSRDWKIESYCLGQKRGIDIVALKNGKKLVVETKGAKANDNSPTKKRKYFDSGQIKDHFGKAIVKSLETKNNFPESVVAIAQPLDEDIKRAIGGIIPNLNDIGIVHFWVKSNGEIIVEGAIE
ncbi:hypothetical protein [Robiginitalea biformata]|uniref:Uncharacterized protein n=1 Tax=Robiginitalea biformata (strain ATCC BAA-864 / DSM 15991 / KCTC 12146 / HTCC2501) TaxID=313596 RepID=A4CI82_ROBBH|nr:hypothetical protein [Robiginitalea biformata]EAR16640.1 hypothetical protein RB2501_07060 [Robiginitalea biformata HTCC2501]